MGKTFLGNPNGIESEYEDDDFFLIVEEDGPIEFEDSVESFDFPDEDSALSDSEDDSEDNDYVPNTNDVTGSDSDWYNEPCFSDDDGQDDEEDIDNNDIQVNSLELLGKNTSNSKPSTEVENTSSDTNPPAQDSPVE